MENQTVVLKKNLRTFIREAEGSKRLYLSGYEIEGRAIRIKDEMIMSYDHRDIQVVRFFDEGIEMFFILDEFKKAIEHPE